METLIDQINRNLELNIMPTEQCNFRCEYCYEHFEIGRMKPETVSAVKKLVSRRLSELKNLSIEWFGGEPLVAYDIMVDIMSHVNASMRVENPTLRIRGSATTNGYLLTQERLEELVLLGVRSFQISFDGDREEHDKLRRRADGKGTFDVVFSNIVAAHNTDINFNITIRMHVNSGNYESMKTLIDRIVTDIGADGRYKLHIRLLSRLGGPNDYRLPVTEDTAAVEALKAYADAKGLKVAPKDEDGYICYASRPNFFLLRADGSISKCTVALYDKFNRIGALNPDGTMQIDNKLVTEWSRGFATGNMDDLGCPLINHPSKSKLRVIQ